MLDCAPVAVNDGLEDWRMPRRRAIKSLLNNLLATLASRYSDYGGYWIFGFIVGELTEATIDLVADSDGEDLVAPASMLAFRRLVRRRFRERLEKEGIARSLLRSARVTVTKVEPPVHALGGRFSPQYEVVLTASALSDLGGGYGASRAIRVAPHDPRVEIRSTRTPGAGETSRPLA